MEYDPQEEQRIRELQEAENLARDTEGQTQALIEAEQSRLDSLTADPEPAPQQQQEQQQQQAEPEQAEPVEAAQQQETQQVNDPDSDIGPDGYYKKPTLDEFTGGMGYDNDEIRERLSAAGTGLVDFAVEGINMMAGWVGFDQPVPKLPEYESQIAQSARELSSVVLPTMLGGGAAVSGIKGLQAVKGSATLTATLPRVIGTNAAQAGSGALVGAISATSREDNATGALKQNYPRTWGWLPDWLATNESDSPDDKWRKNIVEGTFLDSTLGVFEAVFAVTRSSVKSTQVVNWVPGNEKAGKYFDKNLPRSTPAEAKEYFIDQKLMEFEEMNLGGDFGSQIQLATKEWDKLSRAQKKNWRNITNDNSPQINLYGSERAQNDALDELGQYNLSKATDLDQPVFGVHDMYGYRESGIRQVDDLGVVGASVDAARIQGQIDTINGRLGSMISDPVIKLANNGDQLMVDDISKGLAGELKAAGQYGYVTNTGKQISFEQIQDAGDLLATKLYGRDVDELAETLEPFLGKPSKNGIRALNTEGGQAVDKAIKKYRAEMLDPDLLRAKGLLSTSLSGQVADMAQGVRLMEGTEALARGSEQVLDRLEFLMNLKAGTDFELASRVNLGSIWKRLNTWGPDAAVNKSAKQALKQWEETFAAGDQAMSQIRQQTAQTVSTMRQIAKEQPALMEPFLFAYEMSGGALNSMHSLNRYFNETTGVWNKAFVDFNSDVPSVYNKAFWSNIYNNTLAALGTPIKAVYSGTALLINRPVATAAGALMTRDTETLRRGWYMYSGALDTLSNGADYMKRVWAKAGTDPYMPGVRENIGTQDQKQIAIMRKLAAGYAADGKLGPQIMVDKIDEMLEMSQHPWLRFGTRSMSAFDGFVQGVVGNWEARARAFDQLTNAGTTELTRADVSKASKQIYADMFDETGLMTDKAVKYASGEISFNLDSGWSEGLSSMLETLPVLKPFMMFTKTPMTAAAFTASSNPLALFNKNLQKFGVPFEQMDGAKVEKLLNERGIQFDSTNVRAEYEQIRAEMKGRKAIGGIAVGLGVGMFMNDRLRGDGLYDEQTQALRRDADWEKRTYKGWDGKWYSYDGLGPISDFIAVTANIMDNGLDFDASGKAALTTSQTGENLRALGHVLGSTITERYHLANLEPLIDILRGDPGAINRWAGGFIPSATIPGANGVMEFYKLLDSNKRIVENNMLSQLANRTPLKSALSARYDWIDGGVTNDKTDFWTRVWNNYTPWKVTGAVSPEKQFLMDIGYDARPTVTSNGKGVVYTPEQQSEMLSLIGQRGYFKQAIKDVMVNTTASDFRKEFKAAQKAGTSVKLETFDGLHKELDDALAVAINLANEELSSANDVEYTQYQQDLQEEKLIRGDTQGAIETIKSFGNN